MGERIRAAREAEHKTQEELGKACGVTKQTIFKYENNVITNIPIDKLENIAAFLNVSPSYLLGWTPAAEAAIGIQENLFENRSPTLAEGVVGLSRHIQELKSGYDADFSDIPAEHREKVQKAYELSKALAALPDEDFKKFCRYAKYLDSKGPSQDESSPTTMDEFRFAEYLIGHGVNTSEYENLPDPGHAFRTKHIAKAQKFLSLYNRLSEEQQKTADDFMEFLSRQNGN